MSDQIFNRKHNIIILIDVIWFTRALDSESNLILVGTKQVRVKLKRTKRCLLVNDGTGRGTSYVLIKYWPDKKHYVQFKPRYRLPMFDTSINSCSCHCRRSDVSNHFIEHHGSNPSTSISIIVARTVQNNLAYQYWIWLPRPRGCFGCQDTPPEPYSWKFHSMSIEKHFQILIPFNSIIIFFIIIRLIRTHCSNIYYVRL